MFTANTTFRIMSVFIGLCLSGMLATAQAGELCDWLKVLSATPPQQWQTNMPQSGAIKSCEVESSVAPAPGMRGTTNSEASFMGAYCFLNSCAAPGKAMVDHQQVASELAGCFGHEGYQSYRAASWNATGRLGHNKVTGSFPPELSGLQYLNLMFNPGARRCALQISSSDIN